MRLFLQFGPLVRCAACVLIAAAGACSADTAEPVPASIATADDAAKVIDLAAFPLVSGAEEPNQRNLAGLSYSAPGSVKPVFEFLRKQLAGQKWQETPGGFVSDESASGTFTRDGFSLSLMVFSSGKPGVVSITMLNHGNVALAKLPVPPEAKPFYSGPVSAAFLTAAPAEETKDACRKLLAQQGWQPYGAAGDTLFFKQNAVRLTAHVTSAPAQGGKTVIDYSSQLMSVDLPAPADAEDLQYADSNAQLFFDTKAGEQEVVDFYRQALAKGGWRATTEKPVEIDHKDMVIFRNPPKDMLTLEMTEVDGKTRVLLKHQSAAQVAAIEEELKQQAEKWKKDRDKPLPMREIAVPEGATEVEATASRIEFKIATGKVNGVLEAWRKQFAEDGWEEEAVALDKTAGSISFKKAGESISVTYVDPEVLPAEVTLHASGVELRRAVNQKSQ